MEQNQHANEIEFNSMVAVLKRLDQITWRINECRLRRNLSEMLDAIIDYYKEISADLDSEETKLWNEIASLKKTIVTNENNIFRLNKLDNIDIKLRGFAKRHGYTTKTQKDVRKSVVEM